MDLAFVETNGYKWDMVIHKWKDEANESAKKIRSLGNRACVVRLRSKYENKLGVRSVTYRVYYK